MTLPVASLSGDMVSEISIGFRPCGDGRFVMIDALAPADAVQDFWFLIHTILWNEDGDRFANDLFRCVAEQPLGTAIPTGDDAVETLADNRVVRRLDDRCQPLRIQIGALAFTDIDQHVHSANEGARVIE